MKLTRNYTQTNPVPYIVIVCVMTLCSLAGGYQVSNERTAFISGVLAYLITRILQPSSALSVKTCASNKEQKSAIRHTRT